MNAIKTLITIALAFSAAGTAWAQEATSDGWMRQEGGKSRGQVIAELAQARADGSLRVYALGYVPQAQSSATRADVVAELQAARASGELDRLHAEAWHFDAVDAGVDALHIALGR